MGWRVDPEGVEISALRQLAPMDDLRVLELGCGDGRLTFRYAHETQSVLAVDPDAERIAVAVATRPPELVDRVTFAARGADEVEAHAGVSISRSSPGRCDESKVRASCTPCATSMSSSSRAGRCSTSIQ